ncbi:hypothetical protein L5515_017712 [Caenorhabditis briggsae]|uniref:Endoplasmic reticulum junction formation protein lunapark n=1 Tax=Caenorhabditis briggsae TaxID=6238 RepID=A0AAE9FHJ6_CAEBR|nr:hypothetical protein L5515_017712 [Caenorhabditis briggsae]
MMGNLFSRTKSPATELERVVLSIEDFKKRLQTISASNSSTLYYYYMGVIIILSIAMAHTWLRFDDPTKTYVVCALVFGATVIVLTGRYIINCFFAWRTNRTTQKLENAITQKTVLLDLVKETLKFKEAKEILDRYEEKTEAGNTPTENSKLIHQQKQQNETLVSKTIMKPDQKRVETPVSQKPVPSKPGIAFDSMNMTPYQQRNSNATPVRPFLRQSTALDRILDYFMSDGPNCRNALICSICHTHNGMSVPAEYPFISFRCFECGHLNAAKKMGPHLPITRPPMGPKGIQHNGRAGPVPPKNQQPVVPMENPNPSTDLTPSASQHGSDSEPEKNADETAVVEKS